MTEKIICSAIWYQKGKPLVHQAKNIKHGIVLCCMRHTSFDLLVRMYPNYKMDHCTVQGFMTSENRFVNRVEASSIAFNAGQIPEDIGVLYSEDLY
jgi:hypothetical protein